MIKTKIILGVLLGLLFLLTSCNDAKIASYNIVKSADNFEVYRRVVFFNGITDNYLLEITGYCSINGGVGSQVNINELEVICKTNKSQYKKHLLGLSDNVAYFVEQLDASDVSAYHYRVTFKPQSIVPDIDLRVDLRDLPETQ
jgi:hypothetical protein